jgi:hypothetical protein
MKYKKKKEKSRPDENAVQLVQRAAIGCRAVLGQTLRREVAGEARGCVGAAAATPAVALVLLLGAVPVKKRAERGKRS